MSNKPKPEQEISYANEAEKQRKKERLKNTIEEKPILAELVKNPIILKAAEIVNQDHEPSSYRAELYKELTQELTVDWILAAEDLSPTIYLEGRKTILGQVAFHIMNSDEGDSISRSNLEFYILGFIHDFKASKINQAESITRSMIDQLKDGNLILRPQGNDRYSFVHRAFLEYFCACQFVKRFEKRGLEEGLTFDQLKFEVFGKHWQDESWHETLSLIVEMLHPGFGEQFIKYLKNLDAGKQEAQKRSLISKCFKTLIGQQGRP